MLTVAWLVSFVVFLVVAAWAVILLLNLTDGNGRDCGDFDFDRERWESDLGSTDREEMAEGLAECDTLDGMIRAEVEEMLGVSDYPVRKGRLKYDIGWINDYLGPGDAGVLIVTIGPDGRVQSTRGP